MFLIIAAIASFTLLSTLLALALGRFLARNERRAYEALKERQEAQGTASESDSIEKAA